jgi:hypothetical protein
MKILIFFLKILKVLRFYEIFENFEIFEMIFTTIPQTGIKQANLSRDKSIDYIQCRVL